MPQSRRALSALEALGGRIGRHSAIYGSALVVTLVLGLVNVTVLTRFLDPGVFGDLAVLLFFSSLITIVLNLGSLQGAFRASYGSSGEDGDDVETPGAAGQPDPRRALGSAIVYTTLLAAAVTALAALLDGSLSRALLGSDRHSQAVIWAAAAGGLAAVWRLGSNILRLDRRPVAWGLVQNSRPALALGIAIPLVATGSGVDGVLVGLTLGTAISLTGALYLTRRSYRIALAPRELRAVLRLGAGMVPVAAGFWLIQNGDVFVLSRFASDSDVGVYRVATRVGATMAYFSSAVFMAWGPMLREPIHAAAEREQGQGVVETALALVYGLVGIGLVLGLAIFADWIAAIAPDEYTGLAPLIPLTGLAFLLHGAYIATYRTLRFPRKRDAFIVFAALSAAVFGALALLLVPRLHAYGAVIATALSPALAALALIVAGRRAGDETQIPWNTLVRALVAAGACFGLARAGTVLPTGASAVVRVLALAAYPAALVAVGALNQADLRAGWDMLRSLWTPDAHEHDSLRHSLGVLAPREVAVLAVFARDGANPSDVATATGISERELVLRFVRSLRDVARTDGGEPEYEVGEFLLWHGPMAARDALARRLWEVGADPLEVDRLASTMQALRRLSASEWPDGSGARSRIRFRRRAAADGRDALTRVAS